MSFEKANYIPIYLDLIELLRAGLWERQTVNGLCLKIQNSSQSDWQKIHRLAEEQSVTGLVLQGIETIKLKTSSLNIPQVLLLQWIGEVHLIEQQNKAMTSFIADLVEKMRGAGIYTLLVKGQGVAQCYDNPLWRSCGDVDFFLSNDNYDKAIEFLRPLSSEHKYGGYYSKEYVFTIQDQVVELHGSLRTGLSGRLDNEIDIVQNDIFCRGEVRSEVIGNTQVFLPSSDNDVFFIFTHFIKHFYKEGMNLRQICDWCRLIWTFRTDLDMQVLDSRIRKVGLLQEWKTFAALAVDYLGIPTEAIPLYDENSRWHKKGEKVIKLILEGSHGKMLDTLSIAKIFPWNTIRFMPAIFFNVNWLKVKERILRK